MTESEHAAARSVYRPLRHVALAPVAGELIHELALAIDQGLRLRDLASVVHVYPTLSIAVQQLAGEASYENAQRYRWLVRSVA